jgi:response regulator NasT
MEDSSDKAKQPPGKLLIADDDPLLIELLGSQLRDAGYEVIEANDGADALAACIEHEPEIAIIDYDMPGYSGAELAGYIRAQTEVGLIFLTSRKDDDIVSAAIDGGALAYLVKPLEGTPLLMAVRTAMKRGRELRELRSQTNRLSKAVQSSRAVSVATGLMMGKMGVPQRVAFECLRQYARSHRLRIDEVATRLVQSCNESAILYTNLAQGMFANAVRPTEQQTADPFGQRRAG